MTDERRIFANPEALFDAAAEHIAGEVIAADAARGSASIVLAGGSTPAGVYDRLARQALPWDRIEWYWGDERYVPPDDPHSNYRMAREHLLDGVPIDPRRVHPMPTGLANPVEAAVRYESLLQPRMARPFDVVLLGLGEDGHTASIFPGSKAVHERVRLSMAVEGPSEPRRRITMTFPALLNARHVHVLAAGASKASPLEAVGRRESPDLCPAAFLRTAAVPVTWWIDAAAAERLPRGVW